MILSIQECDMHPPIQNYNGSFVDLNGESRSFPFEPKMIPAALSPYIPN